jgi:hypothetical protein
MFVAIVPLPHKSLLHFCFQLGGLATIPPILGLKKQIFNGILLESAELLLKKRGVQLKLLAKSQ